MSDAVTLRDLGERAIIEQMLRPRYESNVANYGDDCASFPIGSSGEWCVVTTDPCPQPMASLLGFTDYYYFGWLLSTINLSDLAAAGATPVGLLSSLILPPDFPAEDLNRMLSGIDDCCSAAGTRVIGGNLKEGPRIDLTATGVGISDGTPLSRRGAEAGDQVVIIGDLGRFWAGYFAVTRSLEITDSEREFLLGNILTPSPKISAGIALRRAGAVTACMDNSDGLYPSLLSLGDANGLGISIDFREVVFSAPVVAVAERMGVDPARFALGWGDWQLVTSVRPAQLSVVRSICSDLGLEAIPVGVFDTDAGVRITTADGTGGLMELDSQRFAADSWFQTGVESYAGLMLQSALYKA